MDYLDTTAGAERRCFPRSTRIRSMAGNGVLRNLSTDDYPLVEVVRDDMLGGFWLYLHPSPDGAEPSPRFHPHGTPLQRACETLLNSFHARTTPPVTQPPSTVAHVYTAGDHLRR